MGFDDLFDHHGEHHRREHHDGHRQYGNMRQMNDTNYSVHRKLEVSIFLRTFLDKIRQNKKLQILVGIVAIMFLAIIIAVIAVLIPFLVKLINAINQNGIQGMVGTVTEFLDRLWKGAGK